MGIVYEVVDLQEGRKRALKTMRVDFPDDMVESIRQQFELEADALGRFESEFIVGIKAAHCEPGEPPFVVMDLLEGEDLEAFLRRGPLEIDQALYLLRQLAAGLEALRREGVVHRDIKPENLFVTERADRTLALKIVDFSIAKMLDGDTRTTLAKGTAGFMAPEQLTGKGLDHRTDVYALGRVAEEMLGTAQRSSPSNCRQHNQRELPVGFERWLERATAEQKDQRFATAVEAVDELGKVFGVSVDSPWSRNPALAMRARRYSGVHRYVPSFFGRYGIVALCVAALGTLLVLAVGDRWNTLNLRPGSTTGTPATSPHVGLRALSVPGPSPSATPMTAAPLASAVPAPVVASALRAVALGARSASVSNKAKPRLPAAVPTAPAAPRSAPATLKDYDD
jgi:serine/threonine-protein kinase